MPGALDVPARIAVAGDWHGNMRYAPRAVAYAAREGADVIVHLGDLGYYVHSAAMEVLATQLHRYRMRMLWVDGNHDDHPGIARLAPDQDGLHPVTDQVWHVPRGYRWIWGDVRFLALGGAHSIDRRRRTPGVDWWPQETITPTQANDAIDAGPADVMFTHDCPAGVVPAGLETNLPPDWLAEEPAADQHRALLGTVVDTVSPAWLWHGHYHARYTTTRLHPVRDCRVDGLGRDGDFLPDNVMVVDLADIRQAVNDTPVRACQEEL